MVLKNTALQVMGIFQQCSENSHELYRIFPILDHIHLHLWPLLPCLLDHWRLGSSSWQNCLRDWIQKGCPIQIGRSFDHDALKPHDALSFIRLWYPLSSRQLNI